MWGGILGLVNQLRSQGFLKGHATNRIVLAQLFPKRSMAYLSLLCQVQTLPLTSESYITHSACLLLFSSALSLPL